MNFNSTIVKKISAITVAVFIVSVFGFYAQPSVKIAKAEVVSSCAEGQTAITRVSDASIGVPVVVSNPGAAWTSIPGSTWIWSQDPILTDPTVDVSWTANDTFDINGAVTSATLEIAADNNFSASLNGNAVGSVTGNSNFSSTQTYTVSPASFHSGSNTLSVGVVNTGVSELTDPSSNPAGVIYKLSICVSALPSTGGDDVDGATSGSSASTTIELPGTGGDDTDGATSTPTTTPVVVVTPPNTSGGPVTFSSGGGSGSIGSISTTTLPALGLSCPFLSDFVYTGHANKVAEIRKVQIFLQTYEGNKNITVNGILDAATIAGIKAFQAKYLNETMGPWGVRIPSGNVYITTLKEINYIVCNTRPFFTPAEQAIIDAFKAGNNGGTTGPSVTSNPKTPDVTIGTTTPAASTTPAIPSEGSTTDNTNLTGAAGQSGLFQSFWGFITGFFK